MIFIVTIFQWFLGYAITQKTDIKISLENGIGTLGVLTCCSRTSVTHTSVVIDANYYQETD